MLTIGNSQKIAQIKDLVRDFYLGQDLWHGLTHATRVVSVALEINKIEKGDPFLVEAGAWLHQFHIPNLHLLEPVLNSLSISENQKASLREIVSVCRPNLISGEASLEARIVFDGDAFDLIGISGGMREIACNLKFRNQDPTEALEKAKAVQQLFAEKLQTETGRRMAATLIEEANNFWLHFQSQENWLHSLGAKSY